MSWQNPGFSYLFLFFLDMYVGRIQTCLTEIIWKYLSWNLLIDRFQIIFQETFILAVSRPLCYILHWHFPGTLYFADSRPLSTITYFINVYISTFQKLIIWKDSRLLCYILNYNFQEPFLVIDDVVGTYELSSCYNVTIECRAGDMIATVR